MKENELTISVLRFNYKFGFASFLFWELLGHFNEHKNISMTFSRIVCYLLICDHAVIMSISYWCWSNILFLKSVLGKKSGPASTDKVEAFISYKHQQFLLVCITDHFTPLMYCTAFKHICTTVYYVYANQANCDYTNISHVTYTVSILCESGWREFISKKLSRVNEL